MFYKMVEFYMKFWAFWYQYHANRPTTTGRSFAETKLKILKIPVPMVSLTLDNYTKFDLENSFLNILNIRDLNGPA